MVLVTGAAVVTAGAAVTGNAYGVRVGDGAEGMGTLLVAGAAVDVTVGKAVLVTAAGQCQQSAAILACGLIA